MITRPPVSSSISRMRGIERSSTTTSAPSPMAMRAAFIPTTPPPSTSTRAGATPGTPQNSRPMPPLCFNRVSAAENTAMRPATSDMGASSGRPPRASVTVS